MNYYINLLWKKCFDVWVGVYVLANPGWELNSGTAGVTFLGS